MYRPGELDQKIDITGFTRAPDGSGGSVKTPYDVATNVWCKVKPVSGKESERFDKLNAEELTMFIIRKRDGIDEEMSITFDGDGYNIRNIPKTSKRELYMTIYAERGVAL